MSSLEYRAVLNAGNILTCVKVMIKGILFVGSSSLVQLCKLYFIYRILPSRYIKLSSNGQFK